MDESNWIATTILGVVLIVTIVIMTIAGCNKASAHPLYDGAPWAASIGETFHLTTCQDAEEKIIKLGNRKHELQRMLILHDTPGMHEIVDPKIEVIDEWINDIGYWLTATCKET